MTTPSSRSRLGGADTSPAGSQWRNVRRFTSVLAVVFTVALAGIGVSRAQADLVPSSCDAQLINNGTQVRITWDGGGDWVAVVRDGEPLVTVPVRDNGRIFDDLFAPAGTVTYEVARGNFDGTNGTTRECGTVGIEAPTPVRRVTQCGVSIAVENGQGTIDLDWDRAEGALGYVVWNNGRQIHTTTDTSYTIPGSYDGLSRQHFAVSSTGVGNNTTNKHYCGDIGPEDLAETPIGATIPERVPSCSAERSGNRGLYVEWDPVARAERYQVWINGELRETFIGGSGSSTSSAGAGIQHVSVRPLNSFGGPTRTYCGVVDISGRYEGELSPVPSCTVAADGVSAEGDPIVRVDWAAANAAKGYNIWANGTPRTDAATDAEQNFGTLNVAGLGTIVHISVTSYNEGGGTGQTYCGSINTSTDATEAPQPSCSVSRDSHYPSFEVEWEHVGQNEVVVRRSVDDSPWYWRGRTSGNDFTDTDRDGSVRYQIALRNSAGHVGPATMCTMN